MSKKILLVDDEPHILRVMKMSLERAGFEVITAKNGVEGLAYIRQHQPDAITLDIDMPKMNGIELCLNIHEEFPDHQMHIFIVTSRAEDEFRERTASFPLVNFLEKPVSLRNLVLRFQEVLDDTSGLTKIVAGA